MNFKEFLHIYALGCIGHMFIEILWRGYTHWSMGIVGGICMCAIYIIEEKLFGIGILQKAVPASLFITVMELFSGILLNKLLRLDVWDYSELKCNFMGQISLLYSILWYLLCIPALLLCKILRHRVFNVLLHTGRNLAKNER